MRLQRAEQSRCRLRGADNITTNPSIAPARASSISGMTRSTLPHVLRFGYLLAVGAALASAGCLVPAKLTTADVDANSLQESAPCQLSPVTITADGLVDVLRSAEDQTNARPAPVVRFGPPLYDAYSTKALVEIEPIIRNDRSAEPRALLAEEEFRTTLVAAPLTPLVTAQIQPVPPPAPLPSYPGIEQLPPVPQPGLRLQPSGIANQKTNGQLGTMQRFKPIQQISLDITPPAIFDDSQAQLPPPPNYAAEALPLLAQQQPFTRGDIIDYGCDLHPAMPALNFCYQPLYFEEVNLERYGRSYGIFQPVVSAVHFYSSVHTLPYCLFAQPARRCTYHAHWTLPGYRIPGKEHQRVPVSGLGGAAQLGVAYGFILLFP
jgi:hypothetical protein